MTMMFKTEDILSPEVTADPYAYFGHLRETDPVHWNPLYKKWIVTRHADFDWGVHDHELFSSRFMRVRDPQDEQPPINKEDWGLVDWFKEKWDPFVTRDRPEHLHMRGAINKWFTPRAVEKWRAGLRAAVLEIIAAHRTAGWMDVKAMLAMPLPLLTVAWMLDVPLADMPYLAELTNKFLSPGDGGDRVRNKYNAAIAFRAYCDPLIKSREKSSGEDLVSILAEAERRGVYTRDQSIASIAQIMMAGHETSANLICNGLIALVRNPVQWDLLKSDPQRMAVLATEETLRFEPSLKDCIRIAKQDVHRHDKTIRAGDMVSFMILSANRDPRVFANPDVFDISRSPNPHVGFGAGIHHCLGAALARVEVQEALRAFAESFPRIDVKTQDIRYAPHPSLRQIVSLEICWN